jgi:hypothetical protein
METPLRPMGKPSLLLQLTNTGSLCLKSRFFGVTSRKYLASRSPKVVHSSKERSTNALRHVYFYARRPVIGLTLGLEGTALLWVAALTDNGSALIGTAVSDCCLGCAP